MIFKIMKLLLKAEKWVVKRIDNDSLGYEDCIYAIKKHENELSRIQEDTMFCINRKCSCKKCTRHPSKIKLPILHSFADLENTQYCTKAGQQE